MMAMMRHRQAHQQRHRDLRGANSHDKFLINFKNLCQFFGLISNYHDKFLDQFQIFIMPNFFHQFQVFMPNFLINFKSWCQFFWAFEHFQIFKPLCSSFFPYQEEKHSPSKKFNFFLPPRFFSPNLFLIFASRALLMWLGDNIGTQFARKLGWARALAEADSSHLVLDRGEEVRQAP